MKCWAILICSKRFCGKGNRFDLPTIISSRNPGHVYWSCSCCTAAAANSVKDALFLWSLAITLSYWLCNVLLPGITFLCQWHTRLNLNDCLPFITGFKFSHVRANSLFSDYDVIVCSPGFYSYTAHPSCWCSPAVFSCSLTLFPFLYPPLVPIKCEWRVCAGWIMEWRLGVEESDSQKGCL